MAWLLCQSNISVSVDVLGGKDYLLTVDCRSKWVEVGLLRDSTISSEVITQVNSTSVRYGIPSKLIFDNGPQCAGRKFRSPKYPQANGQVEKAIETLKAG